MKLILYIILIVLTSSLAYTQWEQLPNGLGTRRVYSIAVEGNKVIAGTEDNGVFLSNNLGNNWEPIGLSSQIIGTVAFNGNTILAGTDGSGIFISTDNGKNWNNPLPFDMIYTFTYGNNKIFAGAFTGVYYSTDNGNSWIKNNKMNSSIGNIIAKGNTVIASTAVGIYKSTDNGDNWVKSSNGLDEGEYFALAVSDNKVYASSGGKIFLSTDFGNNWTKKTDVKADAIFTLSAYGNNVFAGTLRENIFLSTDNGTNWVKKDEGLTGRTVKTLAISNDNIFAATDAGVFRAKLSDMLSTDVKEDLGNNTEFIITPNPAKEFIYITNLSKFYHSLPNGTLIQIINSLGECFFSEQLNLNTQNIRLNIDFLPTGLYYLRISDQFIKFIKL